MKKVVSLLLIVVLALGMATVTSAASLKATGLAAGTWSYYSVGDDDLRPGDTVEWWFPAGTAFAYNNTTALVFDSGHVNQIKRALDKSLSVRMRIVSGGNPFDSIDTEVIWTDPDGTGSAFAPGIYYHVTAETLDPYCSIKDIDAEIDFYFIVDGDRTDDEFIWDWDGTFENEITECYEDSIECDTSDGQIAEAQEYIPSIDLLGGPDGSDVVAHVRMAKDKKIYFRANTDAKESDEAIMDKYKSIEWVYGICQVGLDSYSGNFIEFTDIDSSYFVYGLGTDGLVYLGKGNDTFPLYSRYYIANSKIELDEPVDDDEAPEEEEVPDNYNPGTGR